MLESHWSLGCFSFPGRFCQGRGHPIRRQLWISPTSRSGLSRSREPSSRPSDRPNGLGQVSTRKKKFCPVSRKQGRRRQPKEVETDLSLDSIDLFHLFQKGEGLLSSNFNWNWFNDCCVWIQRSCSLMSFVRSVWGWWNMTYVVLSVIFCHMSKRFGIFWWNKRLFCVFLCTCCVSAQVVEHHEKKEFIEKIQKEPVFLQSLHDDTQGHNGSVFHIFLIRVHLYHKIHTTANCSNQRNQVLKATCISWTYLYMSVSHCVSRFSPKQIFFRGKQ